MMSRFSFLFLLLITSLVSAEKYALLVGINDYQGDISPLRYCVTDVEAFRDALVDVADYKPENVHLLTDQMEGRDLPQFNNVLLRLETLARQVQPEDTFIFYFSGHGISNQDQSYLLALDSDTTTQRTLRRSAIPIDEVNEILSEVKAQQLLTIIDACRNDPSSGRGNQDNLLSDNFARGFKIQRQSTSSGKPAVSATLYACSVGERAYEWSDKKHGVFSYFLLQGLKGKAANDQGDVTITDLADYTQEQVANWSQTYQGKTQTPWLSLQGGSKLVLAEGVVPESVKVDQPTETVKGETVETKATLFVSSVPQGATVYINQQQMVDKTPAVLRIDTGISRQKQVEVGLELDGYETMVMKANLVGGDLVEVKNINLVKIQLPTQRDLQVTSNPSSADVYLDGVRVGQTPFQTQIDFKSHRLKLTLTGYQDWQRSIPVVSAQITSSVQHQVDLVKLPTRPVRGEITINSSPTGADVYLDGSDQSRQTPVTLRSLSLGLHSIRLKLDGYQDYKQQVKVAAGQPTEIDVELTPLVSNRPQESVKGRSIFDKYKWPIIGGGTALVGAGAALFLLGGDEEEKTTTLNLAITLP